MYPLPSKELDFPQPGMVKARLGKPSHLEPNSVPDAAELHAAICGVGSRRGMKRSNRWQIRQ